MLRCSVRSCADSVAIAGEWTTGEPEYNKLAPRYLLRFAYPALPFFHVPDNTPSEVGVAIENASSVVWTDPLAAANRLRQVVERLLDKRGVRKWSVTKKPVQLGNRIAELRTRPQYAQVADLFDALRARGNVGSHGGGLDVVHVLEMAQVLGLALELLYDKADDQTKALASHPSPQLDSRGRHADARAERVDVASAQPCNFSPAKSGIRADQHQGAILTVHFVDEALDSL